MKDNPVVRWAEDILDDESLKEEVSYQHFLTLKRYYVSLLKRFDQVTRLSDGYQQGLRELNESLYQAARKDPLTGLSNRRDMLSRLETEVSRARRYGEPLSVILIDIDHFKSVNDEYGHEVGDRVLKQVANRLSENLRSEDFCARWGGEEFLVCLPNVSLNGARTVAEKLRQSVQKTPGQSTAGPIRLTISLGVAGYSADQSLDDIVRTADTAMFQAKRNGRNRVYVLHEPSSAT